VWSDGVMWFKSLKIKAWLLVFILAISHNVVFANDYVPLVEDLRVLKNQADSRNLPILIMFSAEDCEFCKVVRENYLLPMAVSGDYESKILFRELLIEDFDYLRNEKGELITGDTLALKYDVEVTPTILFVNSDLQEVTKRIVGIGSRDFFDHRLNARIHQAKAALNKI